MTQDQETKPAPTPAELGAAWLAAKRAESEAIAHRISIEDQIVALTGKRDEGSKTHRLEGYAFEITGNINRKMDWEKWDKVADQFPPELRPIKPKREVDEKGCEWLKANRPDLYALLPIEVNPGKTGVSVKALAE